MWGSGWLGESLYGEEQIFSFVSFLGHESTLRAKMGHVDGGMRLGGKLTYRVSLLVYSEKHLYKSHMEYDGVMCGDGDVVAGR